MSKLRLTATDRAGNQTAHAFTLFKDTISRTVTITAPPVAPLHFRVSWSGHLPVLPAPVGAA